MVRSHDRPAARCVGVTCRHHEGPVRLEPMQNAIDLGKSAAARILCGAERRTAAGPARRPPGASTPAPP
jgi:hypothetical protein